MLIVQNVREMFLTYLAILCDDTFGITIQTEKKYFGFADERHWYFQESHPKKRRQLETVHAKIVNPFVTKEIEGVPARNIPWICSTEKGEDYFQELMDDDKGNYVYNYGERIVPQLRVVIEKLGKGYTNNGQIVVGKPDDHNLSDRPCLQLIDFKRLPEDRLQMSVYFRSWDIFALPFNLIGLSYLFELVCVETLLNSDVLYVYSSGLNIRGDMLNLGNNVVKYLQV